MLEQSLLIDPRTMKIEFRKGDSGKLCLRLTENMEDCVFWFVVKENAAQKDSEAPIYQEYDHPSGTILFITISEKESDRLTSEATSECILSKNFKDYIWAVKYAQRERDELGNVIGYSFVRTLIPYTSRKTPIFRVYPEIIEGPNV